MLPPDETAVRDDLGIGFVKVGPEINHILGTNLCQAVIKSSRSYEISRGPFTRPFHVPPMTSVSGKTWKSLSIWSRAVIVAR